MKRLTTKLPGNIDYQIPRFVNEGREYVEKLIKEENKEEGDKND